ncbi:NADH dehydrogenase (ubiquinone) complex I, assembly factor 6-like [Watersipora subatra]|uniref:NADH dehydrogenase (ubiquinone) complex I, assembly factor 6-like n=1 Tax=Watersipora subatra TaxID=2589382 RepID=UPI00355C3FBD
MLLTGVCQHCFKRQILKVGAARRFSVTQRVLTNGKNTAAQYILNRVRTYDYQSYLMCLLSPKAFRQSLFVVHAYNVELSLVLELASERKASAGRFAFWTAALDAIYDGSRPYDHPVVQQLAALHSRGLINSQQTKHSLYQMLNSRREFSTLTHVDTLTQLETYAEHTQSSLLLLALAFAQQSTVDSDHAASHLGRCGGLLNALRATPYLTSRNQLLLPQDVLSKHGVSQTDVLRGRDVVTEPVYEIASTAHSHLETANGIISRLPKEASRCFLLARIYAYQLEQLQLCDFNIFHSKFQKKDRLLAWRMWKARRSL